MDNADSISRILNVFSHMVSFDLETKTDEEALAIFLGLLRKEDPFILVTRDGPMFLALARRFGLVPPNGQERLYQDGLPADQVLEIITRWARFRAVAHDLAGGRELIANYGQTADHRSDSRSVREGTPPAPSAPCSDAEVQP